MAFTDGFYTVCTYFVMITAVVKSINLQKWSKSFTVLSQSTDSYSNSLLYFCIDRPVSFNSLILKEGSVGWLVAASTMMMGSLMAWQLAVLFALFNSAAFARLSSYTEYLREKFDHKFDKSCQKYAFIDRYLKLWEDDSVHDYVAFVFHEHGQTSGAGGGLGDRLGGLLTAFAFAIRTNRKFIVQSDDSELAQLFRPIPTPQKNLHTEGKEKSWSDWKWLSWEHSFGQNLTNLRCVNPNRWSQHCALDSTDTGKAFRVIRYAGNRCYMCRWLKLANSDEQMKHLKESLGIDWNTNLYELAGCLLRMALHPTDLMWEKVDSFLNSINIHGADLSYGPFHQIGVHFRCGDSSFDESSHAHPNPECYWSPDVPWHGTNFGDDQTMDSPLDLARCVNQSAHSIHKRDNILPSNRTLAHVGNLTRPLEVAHHGSGREEIRHHHSGDKRLVVFVASDNVHSAKQISTNIGDPIILLPKGSCHIDMKTAEGKASCAENTLVQWFSLSLSDFLITQEMEMQTNTVYSDPVTDQEEFKRRSPAPISAFSRYAVTYGLSSHLLRYGHCQTVNPVTLSHYTHGNWLCVPKMFY